VEVLVIQTILRVVHTIVLSKFFNLQHKNTKTLSIQHPYNK